MNKVEQKCLISLFNLFNEKFSYVVLRNAEELPLANTSNDIDILVKREQFQEIDLLMKTLMCENGFNRVERTSFHGIECYTFYRIDAEKIYSLKIDLFFHMQGGGAFYLDFNQVIKYRVPNTNGVCVLPNDIEAVLTAMKVIAAGGKLKEQYLSNLINSDIAPNHELIVKLPSKTHREYLISIINNKSNPSVVNRRRVALETLINNFLKQPLKSLGRISYHYYVEFRRLLRKNCMIALVGPDGAGKTSLVEGLMENLRPILRSPKERVCVFHHRPRLLRNIRHIFKKELNEQEFNELNFNPHGGAQSSFIVSAIKLFYYSMDYLIGYLIKVFPLQRKDKIILFDRYFYDFVVDQKRSAIKLPKWFAMLYYKLFIPKPNRVIFIEVDPEEAHRRKQELQVEVIANINDSYNAFTEERNEFFKVRNDELDKAVFELTSHFVEQLSKPLELK